MTRNLRRVYAGWFAIVSAAIVFQLYLAGYAVFGFNGLNGWHEGPHAHLPPGFDAHFIVGDLIGIAILVGVGLAFAARVPWRITYINGGLLVLMVIQFLLAHTGVQVIGALHVVNGVLIFLLTLYLTSEAVKIVLRERASSPASPASTSPAPATHS